MKHKTSRNDTRSLDPGWKEFERSTKRALEALGYAVTEDSRVSGSQVDLIALRPDKLVPHQLLVECKSSGRPVGVDEVRSFSSVVHSVPPADIATFGLLVAMSGFTKDAKEFAKTVGLRLTTLQDLGLKAFDPKPIVDRAISWFENDALSKTYVDLTCTIHEYGTGTVYKPVEKFFDEYFSNTKRHGVAVLGNFGSGKTSLCRHYAYLLATRWRNHQEGALLPIYVNLRDLPDLCTIERELQRLLQSEYDLTCSAEELRAWLDVGRTLLILDGFDEMGARLSNTEVHRSLEALARFTASSRVKIVLTCRTHFFRSRIDEEALTNTIRLYVRDWGAEELVNYVNRAHGASSQKTISTIRQTYNLEELARTPMFLKMITDTVAAFQNEVNRAKLYQLYTDQWIESQDYRNNLSPQEVRAFMQGLAQEIYVSGINTVDYRHLPIHIQELMQLRDRESIAEFDQDIRTCTFLVRDANGGYGFIHRSFMEFFLGLKLAEELKVRNSINFSAIDASVEVAGFIACFFESEPDLLTRMLISDESETARANCARALAVLCSSPRIENAMILALDMDPSFLVKKRLIESFAAAKSERGISQMLQLALSESELGLHSLRELGPLHQREAVHNLLSNILRGGSTADRIGVVLEAISTHRMVSLRAPLTAFITRADWRLRPGLGAQLLGAVSAIADADLAVASLELLESLSRDSGLAASVRQTTEDLAGRCRTGVDQMAKAGKEKGLTHGANLAALRKRFGLLLIDDQLNSVLADLYGGTVRVKGRKVSRAKGG